MNNEVNRYLWKLTKWTLVGLAIVVILAMTVGCSTNNKSNDSELNTLDKFWDMLGGVRADEVSFRWDWHLELCEEQLRLDHVLGQRVMVELNGKNGAVRCPISQFWPAVQYKSNKNSI